jgi:hypothetical protein
MKRWIAGLIGGLALAGVAVTGAVFAAPYVATQTDAAPQPTLETWSPAPLPVVPSPQATELPADITVTGGTVVGSAVVGNTEPAVDPTLPSADNPWPEGVPIPDELNAKIRAAETALVTPCMAEQGFTYLPPSPANTSMFPPDLTDEETALYMVALYGDWVDTYDWKQAGCYGAAVHALGMDNAH